jgi:hypothetical protein
VPEGSRQWRETIFILDISVGCHARFEGFGAQNPSFISSPEHIRPITVSFDEASVVIVKELRISGSRLGPPKGFR